MPSRQGGKPKAKKKSGARVAKPKPIPAEQSHLVPAIVDAITAKPQKCAGATNGKKPCPNEAILGGKRCRLHSKTGRPITHGLYSQALADAPEYQAIVDAVAKSGLELDMRQDLIQMRALTIKFFQTNAAQLEKGESEAIGNAMALVERCTKLIERMEGRKYTITLPGVNLIIQQVVMVVTQHLEHHPDLMTKISEDISKIRLPAGSLAKPGGM